MSYLSGVSFVRPFSIVMRKCTARERRMHGASLTNNVYKYHDSYNISSKKKEFVLKKIKN